VYYSIADAATLKNVAAKGWDYVVVTTKALPDIIDDSKDIEPLVRKAPNEKICIVLIQTVLE
jgi:2-dehydropantoate 2-reductase